MGEEFTCGELLINGSPVSIIYDLTLTDLPECSIIPVDGSINFWTKLSRKTDRLLRKLAGLPYRGSKQKPIKAVDIVKILKEKKHV